MSRVGEIRTFYLFTPFFMSDARKIAIEYTDSILDIPVTHCDSYGPIHYTRNIIDLASIVGRKVDGYIIDMARI